MTAPPDAQLREEPARPQAGRRWLGSAVAVLSAQRGGGPGLQGTGRRTLLVWVVTLVVLLGNAPGRVFFDTKLGVNIDPLGFYERLWHLWNPLEWFGALQNQYIGYAFPMGPAYLAGQLLHMPVWITERLWLSLLVAAGFAGLVKLATALDVGTPRSRTVAGLAFALWPTFTIVIGSTSAGILPGLLAPWAVLPLVGAVQDGPVLRAAARSGIAVLFMGGVNATSTIYVLILPALFIATQARGRRLLALAACWVAAVAVATSWWVLPLLLQGRYSFNFLPYVEQSATTSATMSAAAFLRGAGNWTAYLDLGQPWLAAGWAMVAFPLSVVSAAVAAGTGLCGIARRDLPRSGWLRLSLGAAALIALAGYPGPLGGPLHGPADHLLDGALAPFRSVYKVEPVAAAVLALGIAHALVLRSRRASLTRDPAARELWHVLATPLIALALAGLAFPYLSGQVLNSGSFPAVPGYWYRVAAYLHAHSPRAPALVVPAAAHGTYLWGETVDEPLEPLASSPWAEQALVPYGGAGSQVLLTSLEAAVSSGEPVPGLAATLRRSGIGYIVVRNDLNPAAVGYTQPQAVHESLAASGFRRVAAFGPPVSGVITNPGAGQIGYALPSYPAVEIYQADSATGAPAAAVALPVSKTVLLNGGPDALLQLTAQRILGSQPAVIAGDKLVSRPALWAVTDSLPRADHAFGLISSPASYAYTPSETNPVDDPLGAAGGQPRQMLPVSAAGHQTVAVITGAAQVTASSSGSWLAETPQIDPVNAFDNNAATYWSEADPATAVGQWIQIRFDHKVDLPGDIAVRLLDDASRPVPDRLTVRTSTGTLTSGVIRSGSSQPLPVPPGPTSFLRVTIAGTRGGMPGGPGAGFSSIDIPGVTVRRYEQPPESPPGQRAPAIAYSFQRQVPSPASLADVASYPPLARTFVVPRPRTFRVAGTAIAVPGQALDALLSRLTPVRRRTLEVSASSTWGSLPALAPANLFMKGAGHGSWIAGAPDPALRLSWHGARTIGELTLQPVTGFAAAPQTIKIVSPNGTRYATVGLEGLTEIVPPLRTDRMTISFPVVQYTTALQPLTEQPVQLPVGLSGLSIPALADLPVSTPPAATRFTLPCGQGPQIAVDGRRLETTISGSVGDITGFRPLAVRLCGTSDLALGAGRHWLMASRPGAFTITGLSLVSGGSSTAAGSRSQAGRSVRILTWQQEHRSLRVGPGSASYLEIHQNANPGWTATLDGRTLQPVTLDGWQQGYVIPSGSGGIVTLTFAPVTRYHIGIILSAVGVLVLLVIAVTRSRRRTEREMPGSPRADQGAPSRWAAVAGVLGLCGLLALVGGPVAAVVPVLALAAYKWPGWYGFIALGAMAAAGVLTALAAHPAMPGSGAFGAPAQACALTALAAALLPSLRAFRAGGAAP